jgi:hypothetical protein
MRYRVGPQGPRRPLDPSRSANRHAATNSCRKTCLKPPEPVHQGLWLEADRLVAVDGMAVGHGGGLAAGTMLASEDTARPNWVPDIVARVRKRL